MTSMQQSILASKRPLRTPTAFPARIEPPKSESSIF